jgi:hypothetical protein
MKPFKPFLYTFGGPSGNVGTSDKTVPTPDFTQPLTTVTVVGQLANNSNNKRLRIDALNNATGFTPITIFDTGSSLNGAADNTFSFVIEHRGDGIWRADFRTYDGSIVLNQAIAQGIDELGTNFSNPTIVITGQSDNDITVIEVSGWCLGTRGSDPDLVVLE